MIAWLYYLSNYNTLTLLDYYVIYIKYVLSLLWLFISITIGLFWSSDHNYLSLFVNNTFWMTLILYLNLQMILNLWSVEI